MIELIEDDLYYILKSSTSSLWCSKIDGNFTVHPPDDIMRALNPVCMGIVYGLIGKFRIGPESDWKLLLVKKVQRLGTLPPTNSMCLKVAQILILTLTPHSQVPKDQDIEICPKHGKSRSDGTKVILLNNLENVKKPLQKTWSQFMNVAENIKPKKLNFKLPPITNIVPGSTSTMPSFTQKDFKEKEKFDKRVMEELQRMFNESDSFYFTLDGGDLTNSVQAKQTKVECSPRHFKSWKIAENCFFWNMHMLNDLIKLSQHNELANEWVVPMIQGYIQIEECPIKFEDEDDVIQLPSCEEPLKLKMCIVSRRSRHRAGTRYKRRGIDEDGYTANFVETEQILEFVDHSVSFVQIRGSVPLFWSQTGIKYKPPPKIERDFDQNHKAFLKHMNNLVSKYGDVTITSLIDQMGKEKEIGDAFLQHIVAFNHPKLSYVTFDFHEYCRGMKFENVSILTENMMNIIHDMRYCWVDGSGVICQQRGVFRVNCIDCLDRTNIVQSAIARVVLEMQCRKLGLLSPERQLGGNYKSIYQQMWANNGDVISRQYAGTAALKGDYTRTGERKLTGMMRDGVNSANRYFINRVKDVYRQATIDLMLGKSVTFDSLDGGRMDGEEGSEFLAQKEEDMRMVIEDCKKFLIIEPEQCLGAWGLVNFDRLVDSPVGGGISDVSSQMDMDVILLLSKTYIYVANYDDDTDSVMSYQRVALQNVSYIELGLATFAPKIYQLCLRIHYLDDNQNSQFDMESSNEGKYLFYSFCLSGTKLLNTGNGNSKTAEDVKENLTIICHSIISACKPVGNLVQINEAKIDCQIRSKPHHGLIVISSHAQKKVDDNLPDLPCLSELPTPVNLPFKSFNEQGSRDLICFDDTDDVVVRVNKEDFIGSISEFDPHFPLRDTIKEHVQRTRKLQSSLKELVISNISLHDHISLASCGILVTRSKSQLKLGLIREAESSFDVDISNYPETVRLLRQVSENRSVRSERKSINLETSSNLSKLLDASFKRQLVMLNKQSKSRSLDGSNMTRKVKVANSRLADVPVRMSVLLEREESSKRCSEIGVVKTNSEKLNQSCFKSSQVETKSNNMPLINIEQLNENMPDINGTNLSEHKPYVDDTNLSSLSPDEQQEITYDNLQVLTEMKNSHSEGSFMTKSASFDLLSDFDDFDFRSNSSSALSKFKRKLARLTVPSSQTSGVFQSMVNEPEQIKTQAKSNATRSQLRFQHMKSKIILL